MAGRDRLFSLASTEFAGMAAENEISERRGGVHADSSLGCMRERWAMALMLQYFEPNCPITSAHSIGSSNVGNKHFQEWGGLEEKHVSLYYHVSFLKK